MDVKSYTYLGWGARLYGSFQSRILYNPENKVYELGISSDHLSFNLNAESEVWRRSRVLGVMLEVKGDIRPQQIYDYLVRAYRELRR
jgi:hypothetical protein